MDVTSEPGNRQRVVIVGAGFAGVHAARRLTRRSNGAVEVMLVNPTDYFLYLPLMPEVTAGILDPRRIAVPLPTVCPDAASCSRTPRLPT